MAGVAGVPPQAVMKTTHAPRSTDWIRDVDLVTMGSFLYRMCPL